MQIKVIVLLCFTLVVFLIPLYALKNFGAPSLGTFGQTTAAQGESSAAEQPENGGKTIDHIFTKNPSLNNSYIESSASGNPASQTTYEFNIPDVKYFKILNTATGEVETVSVQDYVRGAVAAELPASFHAEAMKAQAICAHSYALKLYMQEEANPTPELKGAHFSADPDNLKGFAREEDMRKWYGDKADIYWDKVCEAADEVQNIVMAYEGEPILAAYHSASGGVTETAENVWMTSLPYLESVESEGDLYSPALESTETFKTDELKKLLEASFEDLNLSGAPESWLEVIERSDAGYITLLEVGGVVFHGRDLRTALGLRSTNFTCTVQNGVFVFEVLGYGHGVGLSQYGADFMARQGSSYREILNHYYSNIELIDVSEPH